MSNEHEDRPLIAPGMTLPVFGAVTVETKGYEITQKCADCGLVLFRYHQPPNMPPLQFSTPYVMCCEKVRMIG